MIRIVDGESKGIVNKKYLGNSMTIFLAIAAPIFFIIIPVLFMIIIPYICSEIADIIVIESISGAYLVFLIVYLITISNQLYSWGYFGDKSVIVRSLFRRTFEIEYSKMIDIGVGHYVHTLGLTGAGPIYSFIYLSSEYVEPKYKFNINKKRPSKRFIKLVYSKKNIAFLLNVLPKKQAKALLSSCNNVDIKGLA